MGTHTAQGAGLPLVSVIIPCYNVEGCLDECLASVCSQTHGRLEVLLVDDGSTDGTGALCDAWAARDPRVSVTHQHNAGLAHTRNVALERARGELVTFVDSDDVVDARYVADLAGLVASAGADFAVCGYERFDDAGPLDARHVPAHDAAPLSQFVAETLDDREYPAAWGKLFKRSFFGGTRFPEGVLFEDTFVWADLVAAHPDALFAAADKPLYRYRKSSSSIMGRFHGAAERQIVEAWQAVCAADARAYGGAHADKAAFRMAWAWFCVLDRAIAAGKEREMPYCAEAASYLRSHKRDVYASAEFTAKRKLGMRLLSISPALYTRFRRSHKAAGE